MRIVHRAKTQPHIFLELSDDSRRVITIQKNFKLLWNHQYHSKKLSKNIRLQSLVTRIFQILSDFLYHNFTRKIMLNFRHSELHGTEQEGDTASKYEVTHYPKNIKKNTKISRFGELPNDKFFLVGRYALRNYYPDRNYCLLFLQCTRFPSTSSMGQ